MVKWSRSMIGYCAAHGVWNGCCAPDANETVDVLFCAIGDVDSQATKAVPFGQ